MKMHQIFILFSTLLIGNWGLSQVSQKISFEIIPEQLYIHTDKSLYVSGETIWMSLYCMNPSEREPSTVSKVAYIELLNEEGTPIFQQRLKLKNGRGKAQFFLDLSIPSAVYYLKAYTSWMTNSHSDNFFEIPLLIVNPSIPPDIQANAIDPSASVLRKEEFSDNNSTRFNILLDKSTYKQREKIDLDLTGLPKSSISVSVYKISHDWDKLSFSLIKYPEGIISFNKHKYTSTPSSKALVLPEMRAPIVRGKIEDSSIKSLYISFAGEFADFYSVDVEQNGEFQLEISPDIREEELLIWTNKGKLEAEKTIIYPYFQPISVHHPMGNILSKSWKHLVEDYSRNAQINHLYSKYTNIRGLEPKSQTRTQFYGKPEIVYYLDDYTRFPNLDDVFLEYINKARKKRIEGKDYLHVWDEYSNIFSISNSIAFDTAALTLIDGVPILDPDLFWGFDVLKIARIDIIPKRYFSGNQMFAGIINFRTYHSDFGGAEIPNYLIRKPYSPLQEAFAFASPDYSNTENERIPDFRSTLYWNPILEVEEEDKLSFYTGDDVGWYQIEVNGISADGELIHAKKRFEVRSKSHN